VAGGWFVRVAEFRDRTGELNQEINWVPDNVKDSQFGKRHSNARDWSISRDRYFPWSIRRARAGAGGGAGWRLCLWPRDRQGMARR
jgi:hypothetical protein